MTKPIIYVSLLGVVLAGCAQTCTCMNPQPAEPQDAGEIPGTVVSNHIVMVDGDAPAMPGVANSAWRDMRKNRGKRPFEKPPAEILMPPGSDQ